MGCRKAERKRNDSINHRLSRLMAAGQTMNGTRRSDIRPGLRVSIVMKRDQGSGNLTEGIVKDILTKSTTRPHGIKVRLESGEVGRVKKIY